MAKHKIPIKTDWKTKRYLDKFFFRSIRSKVLQKMVLLYYNFFYQKDKEVAKRLSEVGLPWNKENVAWELKTDDIIRIIGCSERTAKEYIDAFKTLY